MRQSLNYLITGGTGFMGHEITDYLLRQDDIGKIIIYSRDEFKQSEMRKEYPDKRMRFFLGDVRDLERLRIAMRGVDYVIHAAALKHVDSGQYNPSEHIKTNISGSENVVKASYYANVTRAILLNTDKSVKPINTYGKCKAVAEDLFINGCLQYKPLFSVVRYGNVMGSRGSVIPYFKKLLAEGRAQMPVTIPNMTRFAVTAYQAVKLIMTALSPDTKPQMVLVPKVPTFSLLRLCDALNVGFNETGIRPGEKMHEEMIHSEEGHRTYDQGNHYIITPEMPYDDEAVFTPGKRMLKDWNYDSYNNPDWLSAEELRRYL